MTMMTMGNNLQVEKNKLLVNVPTYQHGLSALANGVSAISVQGPSLGLAPYGQMLTWSEIGDLVNRAEEQGQEVWLRLTSPLHNQDLEIVAMMLDEAVRLGVKRVIYSDPAVLYQVQGRGHDIGLVLSTDTTVTNNAMIEFWAGDGVGAFVLSREFNLNELAVFREIGDHPNRQVSESQLILQVHGPIVIMHSLRPILTNLDKHIAEENLATAANCHDSQAAEVMPTAVEEEIAREGYFRNRVEEKILVEEMRPDDDYHSMEDDRGFYIFAAQDLGLYPYLDQVSPLGFDYLQLNLHPDQSIEAMLAIISSYRQGLEQIKHGESFLADINWQAKMEALSKRQIKNLFIESGAPK